MAEVVSKERQAQTAAPSAQQPFFRHTKQEILAHQRRFGLAYLLLAIGVGVAVGLGIVLIGRGSGHHAKAGTTVFHPTRSGELGAKQIARQVSREYRQADGSPLVAVVGERPNYQYNPLLFYLIRPPDAQYPNDVDIFTVGNGIMYSMCGSADSNCTAPRSVASRDGALMLKREALELSFDTFKTDASVETVTTLLPTLSQSHLAIIFKRSDLQKWLGQPLSKILPEHAPIVPGRIKLDEAVRIDELEAGSIYQYEPVQSSDGTTLLRIAPVQ